MIKEVQKSIENIINNPKEIKNINSLADIIKSYFDYLVKTKGELCMRGIDGAPDWYEYETTIWETCSNLISPIFKNKLLRGNNKLLDEFASVIKEVKYGKGRQAIILLLGKYGNEKYISTLGNALDDIDISAHAIEALIKLKDLTNFEKIKNISESSKNSLARNYAKKYLKKLNK